MTNILDKINAKKSEEIIKLKQRFTLAQLEEKAAFADKYKTKFSIYYARLILFSLIIESLIHHRPKDSSQRLILLHLKVHLNRYI